MGSGQRPGYETNARSAASTGMSWRRPTATDVALRSSDKTRRLGLSLRESPMGGRIAIETDAAVEPVLVRG